MKLIDKYIAKTVLLSTGLVTLLLAGLQIFILLVNQLDDIGHGQFGIVQAIVFVLLQVPYQVYLFFPMASLLGCLIGLSLLGVHHELIVMRAGGLSIVQITQAVLKTALILILLMTVLGEVFIPHLVRYATDYRMQALSNGQVIRTPKALWLRSHNDFIAIGDVSMGRLNSVFQCRFNASHEMTFARKIASVVREGDSWWAIDSETTYFYKTHTMVAADKKILWDVDVDWSIVGLNAIEADEMTLIELHRYLSAQKKTKQNNADYELAYWGRIVQPFTTVVMMVLAIPFVFGHLRSQTMGSKLLIGAVVGFGFYLLNRFFGPFTQMLQWPPVVAAVGPTILFALLGAYLMRRAKLFN